MKIGDFVVEEMGKPSILKNPEIIYDLIEKDPFTPYVSNDMCFMNIKLFKELIKKHTTNKNTKVIIGEKSVDEFKFSRDHFIDEDWEPVI